MASWERHSSNIMVYRSSNNINETIKIPFQAQGMVWKCLCLVHKLVVNTVPQELVCNSPNNIITKTNGVWLVTEERGLLVDYLGRSMHNSSYKLELTGTETIMVSNQKAGATIWKTCMCTIRITFIQHNNHHSSTNK